MAVKSRLKFNEIDNPAGRFFKKAALLVAQLEERGEINAGAIRDLADGRPELPCAIEAVKTLKAANDAVYFLPDDANEDVAVTTLLILSRMSRRLSSHRSTP